MSSADHIATVRWGIESDDPDANDAARAALDALAAELEQARKGCEFGCGPTGPEYVTPGLGLVPACPVHGWVCELLDARDERIKALAAALEWAERERDEALVSLPRCWGCAAAEARVKQLETGIRHVVRHGKQGKQSRRRLKELLKPPTSGAEE